VILNAQTLLALSADAPKLSGLVALHAIKNDALKGDDLPKRLKLLNWGNNDTLKGNVFVGPRTLAALSVNQAEHGYDRVALDYNHNSLEGHPNYQPDPRKVAAYGVPKVIEGDGLYLENLEYTPSGKENAREYCDLSPTPKLEDGEVVFLHSAALCPQGAVKDLSFFSADFLNPKTTSANMDYKKLLLTLLSLSAKPKFGVKALSADATDKDIEAACTAFADKLDGGKADDAQDGDSDAMKALTANVTKLTESLTALSAKFDDQERAALLSDALRDGKIVPLSAKTLPLASLQTLIGELPKDQVPTEQRTPDNLQALSVSNPGDASANHVMSLLGIGKADWDKTK
jgi:phage I-like protein